MYLVYILYKVIIHKFVKSKKPNLNYIDTNMSKEWI